MFTQIRSQPCQELSGVWAWDAEVPFPELINYLLSTENNPSKNLKLAYTASLMYQYNDTYGLTPDRKLVIQNLYANKMPVNSQKDLTDAIEHIKVFINDEYYVEEAILHSIWGKRYKLRYNNDTHNGLGKILTKEELRAPDFINDSGITFEAKTCWEASSSKFESNANLNYIIDPDNFNSEEFLEAFNKLPQADALHDANCCLCLVKKRATSGFLIGINCRNNKGTTATLLGELKVPYLYISDYTKKFI